MRMTHGLYYATMCTQFLKEGGGQAESYVGRQDALNALLRNLYGGYDLDNPSGQPQEALEPPPRGRAARKQQAGPLIKRPEVIPGPGLHEHVYRAGPIGGAQEAIYRPGPLPQHLDVPRGISCLFITCSSW